MKLARIGQPGMEKPALIDRTGRARDLSSIVSDISGEAFESGLLSRLMAIDTARLPLLPEGERLGPAVSGWVNSYV